MKNLMLTMLFFFLFQVAEAQIETKIIGKWEVIGVESTKETRLNNEEQRQLDQLKKASVEFRADGHAKFKQVLSSFHIPDGYWYYNKEKDGIFISEWDNRKNDLMRLWYEELDNGDLKLFLDETPFVLIVRKE